MGRDDSGMPNLSFRNPNQAGGHHATSNYSNNLPGDFHLEQRKTFDNSKKRGHFRNLFNGKGRSQTNFGHKTISKGFENFMDHIPMNQSVVLGSQRNQRNHSRHNRLTMTSNNSLQRRVMNSDSSQRFQHVSSRKLHAKRPKRKKEKKLKAKSLRYKNKEIDIYSFKKVYKNMTNDYPNLEVINFKHNTFRGNIANIIHDVIPKRRCYPMTLDLRDNFFVNMNERDLQNLKETCRIKNVVVLL